MDVHLVGGFLGSGKTTAIIAAARLLSRQGLRVGVVTNDQGRYLVDSAFAAAEGVPFVEVTGGCFCCNYDDLARVIATLGRRDRPDVVFAESVGSCADLVATVVKPLAAAARSERHLRSLSVFADVRFLDRWLDGRSLPFSESVTYIFGKQLEEAGILVVNKCDLVPAGLADSVLARARERFPGASARLQSSRSDESLAGWVAALQASTQEALPAESLDIDYQRYGSGEAELAWLDARVVLRCPGGHAAAAVEGVLADIGKALARRGAPVGHVKVLVESDGVVFKASVTGADLDPPRIPPIKGSVVSLLLNARAQMPSGDLRAVVHEALRRAASAQRGTVEVVEEAAFHPGWPRPTHRMP